VPLSRQPDTSAANSVSLAPEFSAARMPREVVNSWKAIASSLTENRNGAKMCFHVDTVYLARRIRRNWLHLGSKEVGPKIAAIFSAVESCRRPNIPIRRCLADVLPGLANCSIQSLAQLIPEVYAARTTN
jgi:hypothetical protein